MIEPSRILRAPCAENSRALESFGFSRIGSSEFFEQENLIIGLDSEGKITLFQSLLRFPDAPRTIAHAALPSDASVKTLLESALNTWKAEAVYPLIQKMCRWESDPHKIFRLNVLESFAAQVIFFEERERGFYCWDCILSPQGGFGLIGSTDADPAQAHTVVTAGEALTRIGFKELTEGGGRLARFEASHPSGEKDFISVKNREGGFSDIIYPEAAPLELGELTALTRGRGSTALLTFGRGEAIKELLISMWHPHILDPERNRIWEQYY